MTAPRGKGRDGTPAIDAGTWHGQDRRLGRVLAAVLVGRDAGRLLVRVGAGSTTVPETTATRLPGYPPSRSQGSVRPDEPGPGMLSGPAKAAKQLVYVPHTSGEGWVIDPLSTQDGSLLGKIPVASGPHGLCVWPQPGRYSLWHTGITR